MVLTHELAHAYTQLGADIEGRRWSAPTVCEDGDRDLKKGSRSIIRTRCSHACGERYGGALKVFEAMLPKQHKVYRTHEDWVKRCLARSCSTSSFGSPPL